MEHKIFTTILTGFTWKLYNIVAGVPVYCALWPCGSVEIWNRLKPHGFEVWQTDVDCFASGSWVSRDMHCFVCYCEGDIIVKVCPDIDAYNFAVVRGMLYDEPRRTNPQDWSRFFDFRLLGA